MKQSTLYICVLVLMLLELISYCYPFNFQSFNEYEYLLIILNTIVMGIAYIGVIAMVDVFIKQDKSQYIHLFGISLLTLLFSCLMIDNAGLAKNENLELLSLTQFVVYQIGSLINIYIPILIVLYNEKYKYQNNIIFLEKFKKPIGYIGIVTIVSILQRNFRLVTSMIIIIIICIISMNVLEKINAKQAN